MRRDLAGVRLSTPTRPDLVLAPRARFLFATRCARPNGSLCMWTTILSSTQGLEALLGCA